MTPTNAEALAAELEFHGRFGHETEQQAAARRVERNARAAAELRRLAAVEAERDKFASESAQHFIRGREWAERAGQMEAERDALQADYSRLMEKHNNLHVNAMRDRAERDALRAAMQAHKASAWREGFESGRLYGVESERFDSLQSRPDEYPDRPANPYESTPPSTPQ